jgi:hypothetical protein
MNPSTKNIFVLRQRKKELGHIKEELEEPPGTPAKGRWRPF